MPSVNDDDAVSGLFNRRVRLILVLFPSGPAKVSISTNQSFYACASYTRRVCNLCREPETSGRPFSIRRAADKYARVIEMNGPGNSVPRSGTRGEGGREGEAKTI